MQSSVTTNRLVNQERGEPVHESRSRLVVEFTCRYNYDKGGSHQHNPYPYTVLKQVVPNTPSP